MPLLGRFFKVVQDAEGDAVASVSVNVYRAGATVNGTQAVGTSPQAITVHAVAAVPDSGNPTVEVWSADGLTQRSSSGGTSQFACTSTSVTTATLAGYSGTLTVTDLDRIVVISSAPTVYSDPFSNDSITNPLTTDSAGIARCWLRGAEYDYKVSGSGITTRIHYGIRISADDELSAAFNDGSQEAYVKDTYRTLATGDVHTALKSNGTNIFRVFGAAGGWRSVAKGVIDAGGLTITAGGLTVSSGTSALQAITGTTLAASSTGSFGGTVTVTTGGVAVTGNSTITGTLGSLTGLTVASGGASVTGGVTVAGSTGVTQSTAAVMNTFANLKTTGEWYLMGLETIASGTTISVAAGTTIVELTGSTTITTINLAGGAPGASDDGRVLCLRDSDATGILLNTGGNLYSTVTITNGEAVLLRYRHSTTLWEFIARM